MVASALQAEGKTTTAINLAIALANRKHNVLLVDGDLRNPSMLQGLGMESVELGVVDYLSGKCKLDEIFKPYKNNKHLVLMPAGKTVYNPAYSPYWDYYNRPFTQVSTVEPQQYFLVFETGQILEYTPQNLEMILMKDPALHDEYAELSRRKKNSKLFYYMRLYNEKHPLYVPVYK